MSATSVRGAAERLKLASGVGGLGDVTREVDVPQTFDHNLLTPALRELSRRLRADEFKGDDASVARWLRGWIQHLQRNRNERDRKREARAAEKQAREAATKEVREREESEKKRVQAELEELRNREVREGGEREKKRAEERERVEAAIKELQRKLATERRRATRVISQAKQAKEENEILAAQAMCPDGKRARPMPECNKSAQQEERRRPTVLHYRPVTTFQLEGVRVTPSKVHGHGLFSTVHVEAGSDVFVAILPDCGKEQGYTPDMYNDYVHVAHKDGQSAALIDAGSTVAGILGACHEDVKAGYIRAMNHASLERDVTVLLDLREAYVPDWYFPAGEVAYTVWYACHVIAKRAIEPGDELRFEYAWAPKGWK